MSAQNPVQISTFQYYMWRLRNLPNSYLIVLDVLLCLIIVVYLVKPSKLIEEWYPGSVKTFPTIQVAAPTLAPLPTIADPPTVAAPPVEQPAPVVGVYVPEQHIVAVVEPVQEVPTIEVGTSTPLPTANEATVQAWVAAPPSTPTNTPAPGEPGWVESFQQPPECNLFIGYVGEKRTYCAGVYATQTAEVATQ
jgi:hypothetical protein